MTLRLAYVTSHPIQYQVALFRALAREGGVDFRAFFASRMGVEAYFDPGFGKELKWDVPLLEGYAHTFVKNLSGKPHVHGFGALVNPTMGLELRRWGADVAIVHGYAHATMLMTMAACRLMGMPCLIRGESNLLPDRAPRVRLVKALAAQALRRTVSGAVAIGALNAAYWRHYGIPEDRVFLAPYVVDNDYFAAREGDAVVAAAARREEMGLGPETLVVGYAAKLSEVKDARTLIRAFGEADVPDSALVLAGDGPLRAELEALAASYPRARVRFLGFLNQSEMPVIYALSDLFALPSNFEPWGLVVNEAMNLGRPIVASDAVGCAPDLIGPDNGWVFPARDAAALTTVLKEALARPDARARLDAMGQASRRRIARWGLPEAVRGMVDAARAVARR